MADHEESFDGLPGEEGVSLMRAHVGRLHPERPELFCTDARLSGPLLTGPDGKEAFGNSAVRLVYVKLDLPPECPVPAAGLYETGPPFPPRLRAP
jgi:hypothetical protein